MTLVRWSPFRELDAMQSEMNRLFSRFGGFNTDQFGANQFGPDGAKSQSSDNQWVLPVDVIETPDALKLRAALPGIDPQDVSIEVNDNLLTISAQRRQEEKIEAESYHWIEQQYGTFTRSLTLPRYVDSERIEASYHNGIAQLTIPKKESSKPRRIALQTGASQPRTLESGTATDEAKQLQSNGIVR